MEYFKGSVISSSKPEIKLIALKIGAILKPLKPPAFDNLANSTKQHNIPAFNGCGENTVAPDGDDDDSNDVSSVDDISKTGCCLAAVQRMEPMLSRLELNQGKYIVVDDCVTIVAIKWMVRRRETWTVNV